MFTSLFAPLTVLESPHGVKASPKVKAKRKSEKKQLQKMLKFLLQHAVGVDTPVNVKKSLLCALSNITTEVSVLSQLEKPAVDNQTRAQGESPVIQKPISTNPGLKF